MNPSSISLLNFHQKFQKREHFSNISYPPPPPNQKHDSLTTLDKHSKQKKSINIFPLKTFRKIVKMIHSRYLATQKKLNKLDYKIVAIFVLSNRDFLYIKIRLTIVCMNHNFFYLCSFEISVYCRKYYVEFATRTSGLLD